MISHDANEAIVTGSVNMAMILEFSESQKNTGNLIFGWAIDSIAALNVRIGASLSIKKYVADLNTFDPTR